MKKMILCILLCFGMSIKAMAQTPPAGNATNSLHGRIVDIIEIPTSIYPYMSNERLEKLNDAEKGSIKYPLLVINRVAIRDTDQVDCFRTNYSQMRHNRNVMRIKFLGQEKAHRRGYMDVPRDGMLDIRMNEKHFHTFIERCVRPLNVEKL